MKLLNKKNLKLAIKILIAAFVVFWIIVFALSALYTYLEEKKQQKFIEELKRPYLEDTYGGATPEETFEMFLDALKKGDIDLASKYFIIEKQKEWKEFLMDVEKNGKSDSMLSDLNRKREYKGSLYENNQQYTIKNENGELIVLLNFVKYPSGVWKLTEL